jgi:putative membrane protein
MKTLAFRNMAPRRERTLSITPPVGGADGLIWLALGVALTTAWVLIGSLGAVAQDTPATRGSVVASAPVSTTDYVQQSAMTDHFEIQAGEIAAQKSQNPAIREFGRHMVNEHAQSSAKLKTVLVAGRVKATVPSTLDRKHQELVQQLKDQSGDEFDQTFIQAQLQGHRDALDLQRAYSQSGDNDSLRQFAAEATPMVQEHLAKLEVLAQDHFRRPNGPGSELR